MDARDALFMASGACVGVAAMMVLACRVFRREQAWGPVCAELMAAASFLIGALTRP